LRAGYGRLPSSCAASTSATDTAYGSHSLHASAIGLFARRLLKTQGAQSAASVRFPQAVERCFGCNLGAMLVMLQLWFPRAVAREEQNSVLAPIHHRVRKVAGASRFKRPHNDRDNRLPRELQIWRAREILSNLKSQGWAVILTCAPRQTTRHKEVLDSSILSALSFGELTRCTGSVGKTAIPFQSKCRPEFPAGRGVRT
jgi:hypothetical protein